jgi:hypothetical protein
MEASSHSGIARLVQQSLGTSALFPSYVFVTTYIRIWPALDPATLRSMLSPW